MERIRFTVQALIDKKKTGIVSIGPDESILAALQAMATSNVGALVVLEGTRLVGIVSERDYARKVELSGRTARDTKVRDIMSSSIVTVRPEQTIEDCRALMHENKIRHLPVLKDGRVVGMLSNRDVLEQVVEIDAKQIRGLETEVMMIESGTY